MKKGQDYRAAIKTLTAEAEQLRSLGRTAEAETNERMVKRLKARAAKVTNETP